MAQLRGETHIAGNVTIEGSVTANDFVKFITPGGRARAFTDPSVRKIIGKANNYKTDIAVKRWYNKTLTGNLGGSWRSVCWSPELEIFVAVSLDGTSRVMTSRDGAIWTARTAAEANAWQSVCWSPELRLFVAVASSGTNRVMTSSDGITWTARMAAEANAWYSVCWSPELGLFVAVAHSGTSRVMTSSDGITWTARTASSAAAWQSVCWSPEHTMFMAIGKSPVTAGVSAMFSNDGITWTTRSVVVDQPGVVTYPWRQIIWSYTLRMFIAISELDPTSNYSYVAYLPSLSSPYFTAYRAPASAVSFTSICEAVELGTVLIPTTTNWVLIPSSNANTLKWRRLLVPVRIITTANFAGLAWSPEQGIFCHVQPSGRVATTYSCHKII